MTEPGTPLRLVDVAERAGVSLATASRALTGRPGISKELALHVKQVAAELGYVANMHARSLAGGVAATIGLIVHEIGDPYFSEIASGVIRVASEQGRSVQISHADRSPESELAQVRIMRAYRVGAIIVAGSGYTDAALEVPLDEELRSYQSSGGRVAVIGRHRLHADAVLPDNERAGYTLGEHLLELGHRRIAIASGPQKLNTIADRLDGLLAALVEHGIHRDDLTIVEHPFTREGGVRATEQLLASGSNPTAIVAMNDAMATGVLHTLRQRGVGVPDEISVAGFDDIPMAADLAPSLTTVRIPMATMGALAVELTLLQPAGRPRRRTTGHELVVRDSTGPARLA